MAASIYHRAFVAFLGVQCAVALSAVAIYAQSGCPNTGPINAGCGSGASSCESRPASPSCTRADGVYLSKGLFACGDSTGNRNCRASTTTKAFCYDTVECYWDGTSLPPCQQDMDTIVDYYNWIMVSDGC
jgi:hypothetical protein